MLGLTVKVAVVGDTLISISHWQCAVDYDKSSSPTSYSYQIFLIHIYSVSAPSTADSGHKDATSAWYMLGLTVESGSRRFCRFLTCSVFYIMIETLHPVHTHNRSSSYIYTVFQHLLLRPAVIRMQPHAAICSIEPENDVLGVKAGFL
jgi:hypothetical protein